MRQFFWGEAFAKAAKLSTKYLLYYTLSSLALAVVLRHFFGAERTRGQVNGGADDQASAMADVVTYNAVSMHFAVTSSSLGLLAWFDGRASAIGGSMMDRMYAHSPAVERLCSLVAGYELFNLVCCVYMAEYRTVDFLGHHIVTFLLGVLSLHPWCHYYCLFFFGVASLSSVPLCLSEIFNAIGLTQLNEPTMPAFALLFLMIRTAYWPYVSLGFWRDSVAALTTGRVHSYAAYAILLAANIFLTGLQIFWTGQICDGVFEALG